MKIPELRIEKVCASPEGRLSDQARGTILAHLRRYPGVPLDVLIRQHKEQRSLDQNAYLHAVPFPVIAEHVGDSIDGVKLDLMGECFGWRESMSGHLIPVKPHTSHMTVEECTFFIEWLIPFAAQKFNMRIPLPSEWTPQEGVA